MIKPIDTIILKEETETKRLLVSLAHPDDESFGSPPAGTILHYAQAGVEVHYICGTRGEAGSVDDEFLKNYDTIGELRTAELQCAANVLGLSLSALFSIPES
ncbi:MAG: PIG-L family deacetylase [Chloroflexota bacterium]